MTHSQLINRRLRISAFEGMMARLEGESEMLVGKSPMVPGTRAERLFQGQLNPKKLKAQKPVRIEQWVEIRVRQGAVTTELYPSNEGLIKRGQKLWPAPNMVYRRLNFPGWDSAGLQLDGGDG